MNNSEVNKEKKVNSNESLKLLEIQKNYLKTQLTDTWNYEAFKRLTLK